MTDDPKCSTERLAALVQRVTSLEHLVEVHRANAEKVIAKAEKALNERLAGMNEVREQLRQQAAEFMRRSEAEISLSALTADVQRNSETLANYQGRWWVVGLLLTLCGAGGAIIGSLLTIVMNP